MYTATTVVTHTIFYSSPGHAAPRQAIPLTFSIVPLPPRLCRPCDSPFLSINTQPPHDHFTAPWATTQSLTPRFIGVVKKIFGCLRIPLPLPTLSLPRAALNIALRSMVILESILVLPVLHLSKGCAWLSFMLMEGQLNNVRIFMLYGRSF